MSPYHGSAGPPDAVPSECPRHRPGVTVEPAWPNGRRRGLIAHTPQGRIYLLGEDEAALFLLMDGTRDIDRLAAASRPDGPSIDALAVKRYVGLLQAAGLVEGPYGGGQGPQMSRAGPRIGLVRPARLLEHAGRLAAAVPAPAAAACFCLSIAAGLWAAPGLQGALSTLSTTGAGATRLAATAATAWLLGVVHELAHGAAAAQSGAPASRLGISAVGWRPAFFVEIPGLWTLPRMKRLWVVAAGPLTDAWLAAAAALAYRFLPRAGEPLALLACALAARVAWNALPVLNTDGVRLLEIALRCPGLESRGRDEARCRIRRLFRWRGRGSGPACDGPAPDLLFWYGLLSLAAEAALAVGLALFVLRRLS